MAKFLGEEYLRWPEIAPLLLEIPESGHKLLSSASLPLCLQSLVSACFPVSQPLNGVIAFPTSILYDNTCPDISSSFAATPTFFFSQSWTHVHFFHRATKFCCIALCWLIPLQIYKLQPELDSEPCPEVSSLLVDLCILSLRQLPTNFCLSWDLLCCPTW